MIHEIMTNDKDDLSWAVEGPPLGLWVTNKGTADQLMRDSLYMAPNGTGFVRTQSLLRGEETLPIMWRHRGPGLLSIAQLLPEDDPEADPEWEKVRYTDAATSNDVADNIRVLKNIDNDTFWTLTGPVSFLSKTAD